MVPRGPAMLLDRQAERAVLDKLLDAARGGRSGVLVVRGEPGVGKTALLEYATQSAAGLRNARVAGVESEMELAFAALQQLCLPMLDRFERLPDPQREALGVAFGLRAGEAPDRFPDRPGSAEPAVGNGGQSAAVVCCRRCAVAGPGLGAGTGVRGAAAARRAGSARDRGSRARRALPGPAGTAGPGPGP